jgi:diphthamide synthase (EF-2-diphthine--ammonia ligase)
VSYISSWSGGKDSCFACYQAILAGYDISYLANFVSVEYKRVRFHGTDAKLIQLQAEAIGIPLFQKETTGSGFEKEVRATIGSLIPESIEGVILR